MKFPISRFVVQENSMLPEFRPGDHAVTFNWVRPKVGDVVVFRRGGQQYLKRVDKVVGKTLYVSGDNKRESVREQVIDGSQLLGKVILKY